MVLGALVDHGRSVFHNAQEVEEFEGAIGELAEGRGDFFVTGDAQQVDGGIAEGGQVVGGVADLYLTLVFAEGHIADPVQAFDAPMRLPADDEQGGVGAEAGETRDGILHLHRLAALREGGAFQPADLPQTGPVEMFGQAGAGLQMPLDPPSVALARRACFRERLLALALGRGGKNRAGIPPRWPPSARVGCL